MKFVYPEIQRVFDTDNEEINCLVIENQSLFYRLCLDIYKQIDGNDGEATVSIKDIPVDMSKNVEFLVNFTPFTINKKTLLTKLNAVAEKIAISPEFYEETMTEMSQLEKYLINLTNELCGNVIYQKFSTSSIIKAVGLQFEEEYDSLCEKIIDYMDLVRQYDRDKLFIFINLRSYISDDDCRLFFDTVKRKMHNILMIDNSEHLLIDGEKRYIIDKDLCEIS